MSVDVDFKYLTFGDFPIAAGLLTRFEIAWYSAAIVICNRWYCAISFVFFPLFMTALLWSIKIFQLSPYISAPSFDNETIAIYHSLYFWQSYYIKTISTILLRAINSDLFALF